MESETHAPDEERRRRARLLFYKAYRAQCKGDLEEAVRLYQQSIRECPTAEAYTFLGWTYSFMGKLEEAIQECMKAIETDPEYGNPYNDIGAYLIELGRLQEAIPWLEKALRAQRYDHRCFPWMNLGRIWERLAWWEEALICYKRALECDSNYEPAAKAVARLRGMFN